VIGKPPLVTLSRWPKASGAKANVERAFDNFRAFVSFAFDPS
jgi:hypothetical protein